MERGTEHHQAPEPAGINVQLQLQIPDAGDNFPVHNDLALPLLLDRIDPAAPVAPRFDPAALRIQPQR